MAINIILIPSPTRCSPWVETILRVFQCAQTSISRELGVNSAEQVGNRVAPFQIKRDDLAAGMHPAVSPTSRSDRNSGATTDSPDSNFQLRLHSTLIGLLLKPMKIGSVIFQNTPKATHLHTLAASHYTDWC
jgi:hypothetical protein